MLYFLFFNKYRHNLEVLSFLCAFFIRVTIELTFFLKINKKFKRACLRVCQFLIIFCKFFIHNGAILNTSNLLGKFSCVILSVTIIFLIIEFSRFVIA